MRLEGMVKHIKTLQRLANEGHITLHAQTGNAVYWNGGMHRAWYIGDYVNRSFKDKANREYLIKYHSGSFYPYVYRITETL